MRIRPEELRVFRVVNSPEEALKAIQFFEETLKRSEHVHEEEKAFQL